VPRRSGLLVLAGPALAALGVAAYLVPLFAGRLPRTLWVTPWPAVAAVVLGVVVAAALALRRRRTATLVALAVAGALALLLVVGIPLATRLPHPGDAAAALEPGTQAPELSLPSTDGGTLALSSLRGSRVVLVFHRGHF
jgi:hypothetical protein